MKSIERKTLVAWSGDTFSVLSGRRELAEYMDTPIPRYKGNPLIEALPPILSDVEISNQLAFYPHIEESYEGVPAEERIHMLHTVLDLFVPLPEHIDLVERLSCLLREGYAARNPLVDDYWRNFHARVGRESAPRLRVRSSARGMTIMGTSGAGKTTATEAALSLYPQVIQHSEYKGRPFTWTQVVWLKLQCPFDGSIRGLCLNFFQAMDALLATNHYRNYAQGRRSTDEMMPAMQRVASLHSLGLLTVDEIQHLAQSKSGGSERMLNFFTQLVNSIGVPIVFIGTPKAKSVLSQDFRQSRRGIGEGDFIWDRLENDQKWHYFLKSLWDYQYLRRPTPACQELFDVLYDESQGIVDIAVKLFMLSQVRAIRSGQEALTPVIIRSVALDSLRLIQPEIDALRRGDFAALAAMPDVQPVDYDAAIRRLTSKTRLANLISQQRPGGVSQPKVRASVPQPASNEANPASIPQDAAVNLSLMEIVKRAKATNIAPHDALKSQGLVRDCAEFLTEGATP